MNNIIVTDIETFSDYFCVVNYDTKKKTYHVFEICDEVNDLKKMKKYYNQFDKTDYMVTYNGIDFDYPILYWILNQQKVRAENIYNYTQKIIESEEKHLYRVRYPKISQLDLYKIWHYDNKSKRTSLKYLEFTTRWGKLQDIPYKHYHSTTRKQQQEIAAYCINDVDATNHFLIASMDKIKLRFQLSKQYKINFLNMPDPTIGSELMLKLYSDKLGLNKHDVKKVNTAIRKIHGKDIVFPYINFKTIAFQKLLTFYKSRYILDTDDIGYSIQSDIEYVYGKGGIHASDKGIFKSNNDYLIIDCDVASMYPAIAIVNKLFPTHLDSSFPLIYNNDIVGVRLAEKRKPKNQRNSVIIDGFKLAANSIYGKSNDQYSWLRDFSYTMKTTINGQLLLTMLIEELLTVKDLKIIQANTDGITVRCPRNKITDYKNICSKWESMCGLELEYANYDSMYIRDVNNYIAVYENNDIKLKGCFEIDPDYHKNASQRIISIAIANYLINNVSFKDTIENHLSQGDYTIGSQIIKNHGIYDFCIGKKGSVSKYIFVSPNKKNIVLEDKVIRYYVSDTKSKLFKQYQSGKSKGSIEAVNVGWNISLFMNYELKEDYNIQYLYYINECDKIFKELKHIPQYTEQLKLL